MQMEKFDQPLEDLIRHAERRMQEVSGGRFRARFHLMPPVGWLNDPNGLCQFKETLHVFFQYAPLSATPGGGESIKCWGHYTSPDFIHWQYAGVPLLPDQPFDRDGVYSGSALIEDGTMNLYYTGNVKQVGDFDYIHSGREGNTVLVSSEDGIHFGEKKCILKNADYPEQYTCHVRDPKVFKEGGRTYMVLGGREKDDKGSVILLESNNLIDWQVTDTLSTREKFGYMWECPDVFTVDGMKVLSISPQGLAREEYRFQNIYQSGYFPYDHITPDSFTEWDMGFDFYAPQTFEDEKGRRILIGWAGLPDIEPEYNNEPSVQEGWQHCLTVPRVIRLVDGKLRQAPIEELNDLHGEKTIAKEADFATFDAQINEIQSQTCTITIGQGMHLNYDNGIFEMAFSDESGCGRRSRKIRIDELQSLRILVDTSIVEAFINDGAYVMTTRFYSDHNGINVDCEPCTCVIYAMNAMTVD